MQCRGKVDRPRKNDARLRNEVARRRKAVKMVSEERRRLLRHGLKLCFVAGGRIAFVLRTGAITIIQIKFNG